MGHDLTRRVTAEFFGTFWLTFGGCGAAVLSAAYPELGIGFLGVSLAFGLTVLTMAYAVGHISGGHFNPAVTLGLWAAGRCANRHVVPYIVAQVAAPSRRPPCSISSPPGRPVRTRRLRVERIRRSQPGQIQLVRVPHRRGADDLLLPEDHRRHDVPQGAATGFAGIPIGFALVLIHLVSIPVTNTSVNPARTTGVALFAGGAYLGQLWLFWAGADPRRADRRRAGEVAVRTRRRHGNGGGREAGGLTGRRGAGVRIQSSVAIRRSEEEFPKILRYRYICLNDNKCGRADIG